MDSPHNPTPATIKQPWFTPGRKVVALVGTLAGVGVIVVILGLMQKYSVPSENVPSTLKDKTPEQLLVETRAKGQADLNSYGWVDKTKGIVRLPIDVAMDKLIAERQGK